MIKNFLQIIWEKKKENRKKNKKIKKGKTIEQDYLSCELTHNESQ